MPSEEGVFYCWKLIQAAGLAEPWQAAGVVDPEQIDEARDRTLAAWLLLLHDLDDKALATATVCWLRGPGPKYGRWPQPGALLEALPRPEEIPDAEVAWGQVLALLRWRGSAAPTTIEDLEALRECLRRKYSRAREQGHDDYAERVARHAATLPPDEPARLADLFAALRAVGGWRVLAVATDSEMSYHRAHWIKAYQGARNRARIVDQLRTTAAALPDVGVLALAGW